MIILSNGTAVPLRTPGVLGTNASLSLVSGQLVSVDGLPAYGPGGLPIGPNATIGTPYSGFIWLNYTVNSSIPSSSNQWLTAKVATITSRVT